MPNSLYIHIPFCPTICPYCDFHALLRTSRSVEAYLKRIEQEAGELHAAYPGALRTLYVGGGTPSFLRSAELELLFSVLPWKLATDAEVTLEANPGTLNRERLRLLAALGVNRLSIGVQSLSDKVLHTLGRAHGRRGALRVVEEALEEGFRVSVDLILGLPGQDIEADLRETTALGVGHVSTYTLQIEAGTLFAARGLHPDPDLEAEAFELAEEVLGAAGLARYEVSNFARKGEEARHNQVYWEAGFWGALGPTATGQYKISGRDYAVRRSAPPLPRWIEQRPGHQELISAPVYVKEALMLGLRQVRGLDLRALEHRTGLVIEPRLRPVIARLAFEGLLITEANTIRPTRAGMMRLHPLILELWSALDALGK